MLFPLPHVLPCQLPLARGPLLHGQCGESFASALGMQSLGVRLNLFSILKINSNVLHNYATVITGGVLATFSE